MAWAPHIEQWRKYVIWEGKDIPPDLMLSIIRKESNGVAGRLSEATVNPWNVLKLDGTTINFNHAMGLTQCIPRTVDGYNKTFAEKAYFEDMTGKNDRAVRLQIRMGAWVFASQVNLLHQYDPLAFPGDSPGTATSNQLQLALVAYAIGFGKIIPPYGKKGLRPKLEELKARGLPLTIESLRKAFPMWGYSKSKEMWVNRPLFGAMKRWNLYVKNAQPGKPGLAAPNNPLSLPDFPTIETAAKKIKDNWMWLLIAAGLAMFWGGKKPGVINAGKAQIIGRK